MSLPFLTYQQWRDAELRRHQDNDLLVDCPFCEDGCDRCWDEAGQIHFLALSDRDQEMYFHAATYKAVLLADVRALAEWLGRSRVEMLVEMGFHPYSIIRSKMLEIDL